MSIHPNKAIEILGVSMEGLRSLEPDIDAVNQEFQRRVTRSYREKSITFHPDLGGSSEEMAVLNEAAEVLRNTRLKPKQMDYRYQVTIDVSALFRGMWSNRTYSDTDNFIVTVIRSQ